MAKKTIEYEYRLSKPLQWRGVEIGRNSTQKRLSKFVSECKAWKLFVKEKKGGVQ